MSRLAGLVQIARGKESSTIRRRVTFGSHSERGNLSPGCRKRFETGRAASGRPVRRRQPNARPIPAIPSQPDHQARRLGNALGTVNEPLREPCKVPPPIEAGSKKVISGVVVEGSAKRPTTGPPAATAALVHDHMIVVVDRDVAQGNSTPPLVEKQRGQHPARRLAAPTPVDGS